MANKLQLPNSPNTNANLVSEVKEFNRLAFDVYPRSTTGNITFSATNSGVTYNTATSLSGIYANQGQQGMMLLLQDVLEEYNWTAANANEIGILSELPTTEKSNLVGAIIEHISNKASGSELGHIKVDGSTITVDGNGVISGVTTTETADKTITVGVGKDFTTIQAAINSIKKRVDATITINVDAGTYAEDIQIKGFYGSGQIILNGGTDLATAVNFIVNTINVLFNTCMVTIQGFKAVSTTASALVVTACVKVEIFYFTAINSATTLKGIDVNNSMVYTRYCLISNHNMGLSASFMSTVYSRDWTAGTGNTIGLSSSGASTIGKNGTQPQGTTAESASAGGVIR